MFSEPMGLVARPRNLFLILASMISLGPPEAKAQTRTDSGPMPLGIFVGSERERYLRVLQTLGVVRPYPWSIRGFSSQELDYLRPTGDAHAWAEYGRFSTPNPSKGAQQEVIPVDVTTRYNSAFPFGMNDGPVWAGRGLTVGAQGGAGVRHGPISVVVAPMIYWAQNRPFALLATGHEGNLRFADAMFPLFVDRPQRFGDGAYARFDLGQSTARLDHFGIAFGASTANQWWGPMTEFPFILGNNAPGFTHTFVGSAAPWNVGVGRLHLRIMYGGLAQSNYTNITGPARRRFASGAVALFSPRGLPGLELGAARFFHNVWPDTGIGSRELRRPFESLLKLALPSKAQQGSENQLGSFFMRWVLPRSGFEIYGEYGRDDHSGDTRDLLVEPDHSATYGLGFQKAWMARIGSIIALRGELANFGIPTLVRHRSEGGIYAHNDSRQGHTHRGQLLGAAFAVGSGAAASLGVERYTRDGSESLVLSRLVRLENENAMPSTVRCSNSCLDVQYLLRASRLRRYARFEVRAGLGVVYELNRDLARDALNLSPELDVRWHP